MGRLTQERVKEALHYDPETGVFTWLITKVNSVPAGSMAGSLNSAGYIQVRIDGQRYLGHRLAWFYMTGEWPKGNIDHRNTNTSDNHWDNLRQATQQQNMFNRTLNKNNTTGVKGVSYVPKLDRYTVRVSNVYHGCFKTLEEAKEKIEKVRADLHGEFCNHG